MSLQITESFLLLNEEKFPIIWLRDNCQCAACFDPQTYTRTIDWDNFNFNVRVLKVSVSLLNISRAIKVIVFQFQNECLCIEWDDGHQSDFELSWLQARSFSSDKALNYKESFCQPPKKIWNRNDFPSIFKSFDYSKVLSDDRELLKWLEALVVRGIAILKNTPPNENEIHKLANRVGFIRRTHFGDHFTVQAKTETSTFAYTPATLQLHTDIPYYGKLLLKHLD